ncbi:hypothetical protein FisN_6Hh064 [Fistulifera solaris]|uniref:CMP/dCMP-type deaminase domain-containing protein n=1 Tax=Fistulifera solaris TaxID=1519565 RepID=A0A1Z5KIW8_FISSO|nr:hypothetical protein FisN_6Hh064 [Fistulifera solaris]|eukprot:GAX25898.1 hypothetical protein FisN_6Hh064 [Fistulifera solaris]
MTSNRAQTWTLAATGVASLGVSYYYWWKNRQERRVIIEVPKWLKQYETSLSAKTFQTDEDMMQVAVDISQRNVESGDGGPFGCAIFCRHKTTGLSKLYSVGANRVVPLSNSTLHGETVAIQFAQKKRQSFSLAATEDVEFVLCTSCEPCAMCLGATFWSGVSEMICSATKDDAEAIGFDEGPVFPESYQKLEQIGMKVKKMVLREQGKKVLDDYAKTGIIYNGAA